MTSTELEMAHGKPLTPNVPPTHDSHSNMDVTQTNVEDCQPTIPAIQSGGNNTQSSADGILQAETDQTGVGESQIAMETDEPKIIGSQEEREVSQLAADKSSPVADIEQSEVAVDSKPYMSESITDDTSAHSADHGNSDKLKRNVEAGINCELTMVYYGVMLTADVLLLYISMFCLIEYYFVVDSETNTKTEGSETVKLDLPTETAESENQPKSVKKKGVPTPAGSGEVVVKKKRGRPPKKRPPADLTNDNHVDIKATQSPVNSGKRKSTEAVVLDDSPPVPRQTRSSTAIIQEKEESKQKKSKQKKKKSGHKLCNQSGEQPQSSTTDVSDMDVPMRRSSRLSMVHSTPGLFIL